MNIMSNSTSARVNYLWTERYRPKTIQETILPVELKQTFQTFVDQNNIPNLLLSGGPGVGKTTVARAMLEEMGCDYIIINGSLDGNIDTLRNDIKSFASSVSLSGKGRKYVILDEADHLNPNSTQPALRNFMEEYSKNCGFILTCNYKARIIEPLHSRCSVIEFKIPKKDMPSLAAQFLRRACSVLDDNNIQYDKQVVVQLITKYFPDWRRVLNELQRYSVSGIIDTGILANIKETSLKELFALLKDKDFTATRKWCAENSDGDCTSIFRQFYDLAESYVKKSSIPQLVLHCSKYQYQANFVADHEVNLMAFLTECMVDLEFN